MERNDRRKRYFRMNWTHPMQPKTLQTTLKQGAIFYIALAMLVMPSGLCSQSHHVLPVMEILRPGPVTPEAPLLTLAQTGNMPLYALEENLQPAPLPPALEAAIRAQDQEPLDDAPPFHEHIMAAAQTYEVDAALIRAIIFAESSFNPEAVSHRGAQGLMQLMPRTARALGVKNSFDPAMNIDGGVRYFRQLLDRFSGDVRLALAAYNAGSRYVRKYGGIPPFRATKHYIKKVLHYHKQFQAESGADPSAEPAV